ncbi:PP2C family protein-serine/threonine phosphatase [Azohydromonas caseinilytica]|uniref:Serine/threonine-protein phosphatase n=1 Tax=Azohydromonas caseinilytica TaxID=2728836 RepID=A0A848F721_9BURK|nr:PP2C family serine/threonine-protein phosphatase [Azohydromonas caseinilytica]NML14060.1 serine/threonine-protein phosphatase [Azohydromonas caseinilytica]
MKFSVFQLSRKGGRLKNEDRMGYCYTREAGLFALADGMGGHPEGEVAAQLALQTLAGLFQREALPRLADPQRFLQDALLAAHQQLLRYAGERAMTDTPRTTMVACVLQGRHVYWAHCGDSRLYLLRQGQLLARTRDHSYAELQRSLDPAGPKRNRNVLFTCLGSPGRPVLDGGGPQRLWPGDRVLLCSDGLWSSVADADIARVLASAQPLADAVPALVQQALDAAGARSDNVTALALQWEAPEEAHEDAKDHGVGFSSTIQPAEAPPQAADEFDDEEIERSIREINEAIRRSAQRRPK